MIQEFTIQGRLDGLNEYTAANRFHFRKGSEMKRRNQDLVTWSIKAARLKPHHGAVSVEITWVEGLRPGAKQFRPRDRDNIRFSAKFILDALQEAGIICEDNWDTVVSITDRFYLNRNNPRVIVKIADA